MCVWISAGRSSTGPLATTPELYRFQPEDEGIAYFERGITLQTPGTQYVVVFDTSTSTVIGYAVHEVVGAAPGGGGGSGLDLFATERSNPAASPGSAASNRTTSASTRCVPHFRPSRASR